MGGIVCCVFDGTDQEHADTKRHWDSSSVSWLCRFYERIYWNISSLWNSDQKQMAGNWYSHWKPLRIEISRRTVSYFNSAPDQRALRMDWIGAFKASHCIRYSAAIHCTSGDAQKKLWNLRAIRGIKRDTAIYWRRSYMGEAHFPQQTHLTLRGFKYIL